uniref:Integrase catalytic domain-containing protein n=1 Tax=Cereibacter sphaeroides (strain ATCC 17025 / ATH 2.4.3) TaxID=349102 RepID=A4WYG4_CERS5
MSMPTRMRASGICWVLAIAGSPPWCGSQNHHRDLCPGYGRPLRDPGASRAAITFRCASFPTCYGPEFIATAVRTWIAAVGARCAFIEPGSPWENGYCESFNSKLRDELLNGEIFYSLAEARIVIGSWRQHYNTRRPHSSLGYRPPAPRAVQWPASPPAPATPATPTVAPRPVMH